MIEFAAGIMVGGSVGALIMGALLAQTRAAVGTVRTAADVQSRTAETPRQMTLDTAQRRGAHAWSALLQGRTAVATASPQLH
jgi:hypothetical protein